MSINDIFMAGLFIVIMTVWFILSWNKRKIRRWLLEKFGGSK